MEKKPLMLDLCTGKGGAARSFKKMGWRVLGADIEAWDNPYLDAFIKGDVRSEEVFQAIMAFHKQEPIRFVWASPPCTEYAYRHLPFGRARVKAGLIPEKPDMSIWLACLRIIQALGVLYVIENVIGAQPWHGRSKAKYGAFHLWGNVPAILPAGKPKRKALIPNGSRRCASLSKIEGHAFRYSSKSKERREWSAKAAMIPTELGEWIAQCFLPEATC